MWSACTWIFKQTLRGHGGGRARMEQWECHFHVCCGSLETHSRDFASLVVIEKSHLGRFWITYCWLVLLNVHMILDCNWILLHRISGALFLGPTDKKSENTKWILNKGQEKDTGKCSLAVIPTLWVNCSVWCWQALLKEVSSWFGVPVYSGTPLIFCNLFYSQTNPLFLLCLCLYYSRNKLRD